MKYVFYTYAFALIIFLLFDIKVYGQSQKTNNILNLIAWLFVIILIILIVVSIKQKLKKRQKELANRKIEKETIDEEKTIIEKTTYKKRQFLTESEKQFLHKLKDIYKEQYTVQAQIPLRMIIEKDTDYYADAAW